MTSVKTEFISIVKAIRLAGRTAVWPDTDDFGLLEAKRVGDFLRAMHPTFSVEAVSARLQLPRDAADCTTISFTFMGLHEDSIIANARDTVDFIAIIKENIS
jgi:hypothetical protein